MRNNSPAGMFWLRQDMRRVFIYSIHYIYYVYLMQVVRKYTWDAAE